MSNQEKPQRRDLNNAATIERARKRIEAVAKADSMETMQLENATALGWLGALHVEGLLDKELYEALDAELDKVIAEWDDEH